MIQYSIKDFQTVGLSKLEFNCYATVARLEHLLSSAYNATKTTFWGCNK